MGRLRGVGSGMILGARLLGARGPTFTRTKVRLGPRDCTGGGPSVLDTILDISGNSGIGSCGVLEGGGDD